MDTTGTPDDSPGSSSDLDEAPPPDDPGGVAVSGPMDAGSGPWQTHPPATLAPLPGYGDGREAGAPSAPGAELPVVGPTAALRGYPGGPGIGLAGATAAAAAPSPAQQGHRLINGSAWQRAQGAWRESGVEWQRPVTGQEPAEAQWERIQSGWSTPRAPGRGGASRRRVITAAVAVATVVVLAAAAVLVVRASRGRQSPAKPAAAASYPPALVADGDFATETQPSSRGTFQSLNEVTGSAGTVVAVGSQSDARLGRAQFFVSTDGGRSWQLARVTARDGGAPPAWEVPNAVAGGHGGWLALGPGASWTSRDGQSWTRTGQGLPVQPGDQMLALARTANGFLAAGGTAPAGKPAKSEPVIWTSADGTSWHRAAGQQLGLPVPGGAVGKIVNAATNGADTVIAAEVTKTATVTNGSHKHTISYAEVDLFRSTDGGRSWTAVSTPTMGGVGSWVTGLAPSAGGLVVVRPGIGKSGGADGAAFVSADGSSWHYGGTIDAPKKEGLQLTGVNGSSQGAVVAGHLGNGTPVAYESPDGHSWRRLQIPGASAFTSLAGFTVTTGGSVVAAGTNTNQAGAQQGYLSVSGGQPHVADLTSIRGAFFPALTVNGIAAGSGQPPGAAGTAAAKVAVGSSGAEPAVWYSPGGGSWFPAKGATPAVSGRPGAAGLSGVADGRGGWLAVGGSLGPLGQPIIVVSKDGATWQVARGAGAFAVPGASAHATASGRGGYVVVGEQAVRGRSIATAWWAPRLFGTPQKAAPSRQGAKNPAPAQLWTRAGNVGKGDLDGADASRRMLAVTSVPSGFVAVGSHGDQAAAWTSPDGHRWKLADLPPPAIGGGQAALQYVTSSGNRIVATGTTGGPYSPVPFAAVSVDGGQTWQEAQLPAPDGHSQVTGLTAVGGGFAGVGAYGPSGRTNVVVWTSADGHTWKQHTPHVAGLYGPGTDEITALTTSGSQLLGAGFTATQTSEHTTLWLAPPFPARS